MKSPIFNPKSENSLQQSYLEIVSIRPKREEIIQKDEIINLRIMMETCKSLDEFLSLV